MPPFFPKAGQDVVKSIQNWQMCFGAIAKSSNKQTFPLEKFVYIRYNNQTMELYLWRENHGKALF